MHYTCQPEDAGKPLRSILRGPMQISYTAMKSAKWDQRILLNGQPATVDTRVQIGDTIVFLEQTSFSPIRLLPYELPLDVIWEDEYLAVVSKPAPLASQCGRNSDSLTLENAWFSRCGCPEDFVFRPVNRLDKGTSGIMVIAKSAHAQDLLQRKLHTDDFVREYLAVTEGVAAQDSGRIDLPIAKEDAASVRRVVTPVGKRVVRNIASYSAPSCAPFCDYAYTLGGRIRFGSILPRSICRFAETSYMALSYRHCGVGLPCIRPSCIWCIPSPGKCWIWKHRCRRS